MITLFVFLIADDIIYAFLHVFDLFSRALFVLKILYDNH